MELAGHGVAVDHDVEEAGDGRVLPEGLVAAVAQAGDRRAGAYDAPELAGITVPNPLPIQNGRALKDWFDAHVRGLGQVYLSGHDHSRQWLDEADTLGGTELIVNGAGATVTSLRDRGNQFFWQDATIPGFLYVTVVDDRFTGEFFDKAGVSQYTRSFTHP